MKISAYIIAKNEAGTIKRCINSLKKQVNEIIFVDTGSTDDTVAIAKNCGAIVLHYQWNNDFAAARNFAIMQATGDWIVFLDADEYLVLPPNANLCDFLQSVDAKYNAILMKLINIDVDQQNKVLDFFYTIRIFRHHCGLRYQGKIHEQLQGQGAQILNAVKLNDDKSIIYHTGYSTNQIRAKSKRNIAMLEQEIAKGNKNYLNYRHLAECYANLEDYSHALTYLRKAQAMPKIKTTYQSRFYQIYLVALRECQLTNTIEFCKVLKEANLTCPDLPDFHAEYAALLYHKGQYCNALAQLKLAIELNNHYAGSEPSFFAEQREQTEAFKRLLENKIKEIPEQTSTQLVSNFVIKDFAMNINSDLKNKQYQQVHTKSLSQIHSRFIDIIILYLLISDSDAKTRLLTKLPRDLAEVLTYWQIQQVMPASKLDLLGTLFKHIVIRCPRKTLIDFLQKLRIESSSSSMTFAKILCDNQFYEEAIQAFEQVNHIDAQYLVPYGICYYQLGKYQKAQEIFSKLDSDIAQSYLTWLDQVVKK